MNAREAALRAMYEIEINGAYLNAALNAAIGDRSMSGADRALTTELIYGITANKIALDYIISKYSKLKLKKMTPWVLNILRMGVYQIYYNDKIPTSAACNEAVKLAKKYSHKAATGFVNGVLRSFSRDAESFEFPKDMSVEEKLSLEYSYPLWMTKKLIAEYGVERCERLFSENNKPHSTYIRTNTLKVAPNELKEILSGEGIECIETHLAGCFAVRGALNISSSDAYRKGYFSLQNISSQLTVEALDPQSGELIVDMCAAPGGKSCAAAEKMNNCGRVISFDIFDHKVELIKKSASRLGIDIIDARCANSEVRIDELVGKADRVLADVPCSGLGVIHKKPDIKYSRTEADVAELCGIQEKILENACAYVKDGGVLVYSTCSILPEENRLGISKFLDKHREFSVVSERQLLTSEKGESGFYICKLLKGKTK